MMDFRHQWVQYSKIIVLWTIFSPLLSLFLLIQVVLSACSSYFQSLFLDHPSRHPIVILKDVRFAELRTLIEFMYKGEVNVQYCQLSALLKTAESLKVSAHFTMNHKCNLSSNLIGVILLRLLIFIGQRVGGDDKSKFGTARTRTWTRPFATTTSESEVRYPGVD